MIVAVSWSNYLAPLLPGSGIALDAVPAAGEVLNLPAMAGVRIRSMVPTGEISETARVNGKHYSEAEGGCGLSQGRDLPAVHPNERRQVG